MSDRHGAQPDNIYELKDSSDAKALYQGWAATYEHDLVERMGWKGHHAVAMTMANCLTPATATVLDVGCGTGLCGQVLYEQGFRHTTGTDLTDAMLALARTKAVYEALVVADATQPLPFEKGRFDGICSAGLFSHGPLLPAHIELMLGPLKLGGIAVHTINGLAYEKLGYGKTLTRLAGRGRVDLIGIQSIEYNLNVGIAGKLVVLRNNKH